MGLGPVLPPAGAPGEHKAHAPRAVGVAVLTVSDSRTDRSDASGALLVERLTRAGHRVVARRLVADDARAIRDAVEVFLTEDDVEVVITTGGTGIAPRDVTVEALTPLLEKTLPGFGELFRALSFQEVGSAAFASRAVAGTAKSRLLFVLPGSPNAVALALERLILPEMPHLVGLLRRRDTRPGA